MTIAARLETEKRRARSLELLGKPSLTRAEKVELAEVAHLARLGDVLPADAPQAAGAPGATTDPQLRRLLAGASIGEALENVLAHRAADGRLAEIQAEYGLGGNELPLELLRVSNAVTPAPADTQANQNAILQPVFSDGDASYLGIPMPIVPAGDSVFPVLTSAPTVTGPVSDSTNAPETTGAFTAQTLAPQRMQASFYWRRTDAARFTGMEEALRTALASAISEALDKQVVSTILAGTTAVATSAEQDFASYLSRMVYDNVDARYAQTEGDLRALVGSQTLAHMGGIYRSNEAPDTALSAVRGTGVSVRTSPHIPAIASKKQPAIVRRGNRADAIAPTWNRIVLIVDEVTRSGSGEVEITALAMANFAVLRAGGFVQVSNQLAA